MQCLQSLSLLSDFPFEVIVVDDASDEPISNVELAKKLAPELLQRIELVRYEENKGYIPARNEMVQRARTQYILSLDDDAKLFHADTIHKALEILENDPKVGAVALSQADKDGRLLADYMQPAPVSYNCYAQSFSGYGHILRRDLFLKLGGYKESFWFYGEEAEYCKRMLDLGFYVIYLPEAKVIHSHSPIGRNELTRLRYGCRNKCFDAIYNEPLPMMLLSIPLRIINYIRWRKIPCEYYNISDEGGIKWLLKELTTKFPELWRERRPLKWTTYRKWLTIRKEWSAYQLDSLY
jgi:GT2 family glycosyltransferase